MTNHGMENVKAFALGLVMEMSAMQKSATPSITLMTIMMTLMMTLMIIRMMSMLLLIMMMTMAILDRLPLGEVLTSLTKAHSAHFTAC